MRDPYLKNEGREGLMGDNIIPFPVRFGVNQRFLLRLVVLRLVVLRFLGFATIIYLAFYLYAS